MAEITVKIDAAQVKHLLDTHYKPLLDAAGAVADKWLDMASCYASTEEAGRLADLLDTLADAVGRGREEKP